MDLPMADGINNGGYKVPDFIGNTLPRAKNEYSPIDVLVAGLEAMRRNIIITSLTSFFDKHRYNLAAYSDVYINLFSCTEKGNEYITKSISWIRCICYTDSSLLTTMRRNAPLTFKWM